MSRKYLLKPTPSDHPVKQRPFLHEIRDELNALETVGMEALKAIEAAALGRRKNVEPPTPPTPAPDPGPAPNPEPQAAPLDMLPVLQDVRDQGDQGSCFAFAGTAAQAACEGMALTPPARIPTVYAPADLSWNTRFLMGTTGQDSGGDLGDAILAQENPGTCEEKFMPYDPAVFATPPNSDALANGNTHKATFKAYPVDVSSAANIDQALADGYIIYFGFGVWNGFESTASDGTMSAPDGSNVGGHAQLLFYTQVPLTVGYPAWPGQNSWGLGWGLAGREWFRKDALSTIWEAYALVPVAG